MRAGPAGGRGQSARHLATIANRNFAGVGFDCNAASGAGVTTGTEWAIPLPALGSPTGCIRVTAVPRSAQGAFARSVCIVR